MNDTQGGAAASAGDYILELIGYALTSAEMVVADRGPKMYSALRFLELADRLIDMSKYVSPEKDPYLEGLREKIRQIKLGREEGTEAFKDILEKLLLDVASESLRRMESRKG